MIPSREIQETTQQLLLFLTDERRAFLTKGNTREAGVSDQAVQLIKAFKEKHNHTQLNEILQFHEMRYAVMNDPIITDFEYDVLFKLIEIIESNDGSLVSDDSVTQRVSTDHVSTFETVNHLVPMLSLDNSYNAEDLKDFDASVKKLANIEADEDLIYTVEPKYDGGSIAIIYKDDKLVRAATRGNGTAGDEITENIKKLKTVPLKAKFSNFNISEVELRGEALIPKALFKKLNEEKIKAGDTNLYANPRNTATGGLRTKDAMETAKRGIEAFIFQLGHAVDKEGNSQLDQWNSHFGSINFLSELGFKVPTIEKKKCKNIEEAIEFCSYWENKRDDYEYEIDGMVVKVDAMDLQKRMGFTSHHPRWAIAYKFKAKQATSKLLNIEYQVGKIGSITPVAKISPVALAGVTVSSISLHNEEFISSKDIRIGDTVLVERAGDVIPYIVKSFPELRDGSENKLVFPSQCPSCATSLMKPENEAAWRCPNHQCEAQVLQRMYYHVSKDAMNIDGFGPSYIDRFYEMGWINSLADIYNLDYEKIKELEGFGQKSAKKLEQNINKSKSNPISRLLSSLSIHHFGKRASKLIAQEIDHVLDLQDWDEEKFEEIKDIGPVVSKNVIAFFKDESNVAMLKQLELHGVNLKQTKADQRKEVALDAPLIGKTILFTGTLTKMGRKEAQQMAENAGAKNISAVSKNLNILVAGEKAGSKLKKAQALQTVEILTEDEFLSLLAN